MTNRAASINTSDNSPCTERKLLPKKTNEGTVTKKFPQLPTLPEESFTSPPSSTVGQETDKSVSNVPDNWATSENTKAFVRSFSDATNELSSSAASAVSLMVSNVRRTKTDFLAKELESRKELLQALVKDKNDTPV